MSGDRVDPAFLQELEGWAARVLRLHRESTDGPVPENAWGPYDLVGACHNRDRVASFDVGRSFSLEAADELFRSFTEEVGSTWVDSIGLADEKGAGWWWKRVPSRGPVRDELAERGYAGSGAGDRG
jgi:hypothetical protein